MIVDGQQMTKDDGQKIITYAHHVHCKCELKRAKLDGNNAIFLTS